MTWRDFIFKAIRVPFVQDGRDYRGWDCYGLVWCGYHDVMGIDLPSYSCNVKDHLRLARVFREAMVDWPQVERQDGAVAVIPRSTRPIHCGLAMPGDMILHCEFGPGTTQQPTRYLKVESYHVPSAS